MSSAAHSQVLSDALWPAEDIGPWFKRIVLFVAGIAALWVSAKIQVATIPVPITLQLLVVMVIGAGYGARLGFSTLLGYLALGATGQPVFAGTPEKGIGWLYMLGPTGGYLLGFALAALLVGYLAQRGWDRSPISMAGAMALGLAAVYIPGVIWLCTGFSLVGAPFAEAFTGYGWQNWYTYGVQTFIWVDAMKLVLAVMLFPAIWGLVGKARF